MTMPTIYYSSRNNVFFRETAWGKKLSLWHQVLATALFSADLKKRLKQFVSRM
ncbi:hypothetical protein CRENBAI_004868 [Crenichthys baileyi]|uniref:Uncharacterized protein n=1 Tax=Crenichthys baileyi TaxID=28760 RepID=A0AAV9RGK1_9TELE